MRLVMARPTPMVPLGYGKFVRADRVYALVPLEGPERGDGRRTLVHVEGIDEPVVASRSEGAIARDLAVALGQASPRAAGLALPGQEQLFRAGQARRYEADRPAARDQPRARRRVAMPALRERLTDAGLNNVRTYVQSGNVVLDSDRSPEQLARLCERQIAEGFGFEVPVIVRTRDELAEVVERNPLGKVARDPKRYQVSFLSAELDPETVAALEDHVAESERFVAIGRELYAWHPDGVARSKLWNKLAGKGLGGGGRVGVGGRCHGHGAELGHGHQTAGNGGRVTWKS